MSPSSKAQPDPKSEAQDFPRLVAAFCDYLLSYRNCSQGTVRVYKPVLEQLSRYARAQGVFSPSDFPRPLAARFSGELRGKATTVRKSIAACSSFYSFLTEQGHATVNPFRGIPLPQTEKTLPRSLSDFQIQEILKSCAKQPWKQAPVHLMLFAGLRRAEVVGIRMEDVDLPNRQLLVRGKGKRQRRVPINATLLASLQAYLRVRINPESEWLFTNRFNRQLGANHLDGMMQSLARSVGLSGQHITPHTLRHSFATNLLKKNVDIRTIQELLGHSSLEMTARYLTVDVSRKRVAVAALDDLG